MGGDLFVRTMSDRRHLEETWREAFDILNTDKTGFVTYQQIVTALREFLGYERLAAEVKARVSVYIQINIVIFCLAHRFLNTNLNFNRH